MLGAAKPDGGRPPFVAMMSQGTSGDMWRADYAKAEAEDHDRPVRRRLGEARRRRGGQGIPTATTWTWRWREGNPRQVRAGRTRSGWSGRRRSSPSMGGRPPKTLPEVYAREQIFLASEPERDMKLQAIRVGDFGIAAMPNEVFALTGLKIKAQSPLTADDERRTGQRRTRLHPPARAAQARRLHHLAGPQQLLRRGRRAEDGRGGARPAGRSLRQAPPQGRRHARPLRRGRPRRRPALRTGGATKCPAPARWTPPAAGTKRPTKTASFSTWKGPPSGAFSGEGVTNRCPHFAGGRMRADLKGLGGTYSVEMWFWNGLASEAPPRHRLPLLPRARRRKGGPRRPPRHRRDGRRAGAADLLQRQPVQHGPVRHDPHRAADVEPRRAGPRRPARRGLPQRQPGAGNRRGGRRHPPDGSGRRVRRRAVRPLRQLRRENRRGGGLPAGVVG